MLRLKGFFYLLLFNILVSGTVTLAVLYFWDKAGLGQPGDSPTPVVLYISVTGTPPTPDSEVASLLLEIQATPIPDFSTPTPYIVRTEPYLIRAGDSLGLIADRFEVSVADLLAVNNLEDPDRLFVGQEILIPLGPLPTHTPFIPTVTQTPTPTLTPRLSPTPTRTPTRTPNQADPVVKIEAVLGPGDFTTERVLVVHTGGRDVSLEGWQLQDGDGNVYTFPQLTLRQGSLVYIHTRAGVDSVSDLFWGRPQEVWKPGESAVLVNAFGQEVFRFVIP